MDNSLKDAINATNIIAEETRKKILDMAGTYNDQDTIGHFEGTSTFANVWAAMINAATQIYLQDRLTRGSDAIRW